MFKNPLQVAIIFAAISLLVKLSVFSMDIQHGDMEKYIWYIYMLILLIAVFFGIRSNKITHTGQTTIGQDVKTGARTASYFAILMTIITYLYYTQIDVDFFEIKKEELFQQYPEKITHAINEKKLSISEIKEHLKADIMNSSTIFSAQFHAMITLFGLVFIGLINSVVFAFMMKKFPGFKQ
jgi:hypothetical protein